MQFLRQREAFTGRICLTLLMLVTILPCCVLSSAVGPSTVIPAENSAFPTKERMRLENELRDEDECRITNPGPAEESSEEGNPGASGSVLGKILGSVVSDQGGAVDVRMVLLGMLCAGLRRLWKTKYAAIEPIVRMIL